MDAKLVPVVILVRKRNLQPGDVTGLPPAEAAEQVAAGYVRYWDKPPAESRAATAAPVDKAVKTPPKAKAAKKKAAKKKAAKKPKK